MKRKFDGFKRPPIPTRNIDRVWDNILDEIEERSGIQTLFTGRHTWVSWGEKLGEHMRKSPRLSRLRENSRRKRQQNLRKNRRKFRWSDE